MTAIRKDHGRLKQPLQKRSHPHKATLAALEERGDGLRTLRVLIPFDRFFQVTESTRPGKAERPTALILWFDDAMRVRSIMPSSDKRFRNDAKNRGDKIIELD